MSTPPTFGTLFSGGGIADCGFVAAGMEPRWAVEMEPAIADVYRTNFPGHPCFTSRVEDINWRQMEPVDHGHASPSCKNASRANMNGRECEGDLSAARAVCSFIDIIRPATFSLENVWGYRTFQSFHMILECLEDRGYFVHYQHLNSADFGVPQTRERLILRACLGDLVPSLPAPVRWVGWYEAIEDLLDTLPESEFAPWQLARLPKHIITATYFGNQVGTDSEAGRRTILNNRRQEEPALTVASHPRTVSNYKAFLISNSKTQFCDGTRGSGAPAFAVTTQSNGRTRAFLVDHRNASREATVRYSEDPSITIDTGVMRRPSSTPSAFIVEGSAHGQDNQFTLPVRNASEPVFTMRAKQNHPRAWLEYGRVVKMNVRALARFQSVPEWYQFPDKANLACTIIGGGFPSLMAQRIAEGLYGSGAA